MNNGKDKNVTFSKVLVIVTGSIFVLSGIFCVFMYVSGKLDTGYDTAAMISLITVSGSIFGSNLCWYSKKAASENHYKLRMSLYRESADIRLKFNEAMIKLRQDNGLTQTDIDDIESQSDHDEFMNDALGSVVSDLDTYRDNADSENTIEQF